MKVIHVLENDFLDAFSPDLDESALHNVSSGKTVQENVKECLLSVFERGKQRMEEFKSILSGLDKSKHIFTPIRRSKWVENSVVKSKIEINGKVADVAIQRDILGILAAKSDLENGCVDIDKALTYPLAPVSLPLDCSGDGMRKTNKSKLFDALGPLDNKEVGRCSNSENYYVIDLAATSRTAKNLPATFEDLAMKLLHHIPATYKVVYFECDTYKANSIKGVERKKRGNSKVLLLRSSKMKVPKDFQNFLNNGTNKERLFELIEETFILKNSELLEQKIYFARGDKCIKITSENVENVTSLNHQEADTKVVALVKHISETNKAGTARYTVRSSAGDIDIPVIFLS